MNPYLAWPRSAKVAAVLFTVLATGFLLSVAQAILIPVALAVLIAFLLQPLVKRGVRVGLNRIVAVILVVGTASVIVGGLGFIVSSQLKSFADQLPAHEANIEAKVLAVKSFFKGGTFERLSRMINKINQSTDRKLAGPGSQKQASEPSESAVAAAGREVFAGVNRDRTGESPGGPPVTSRSATGTSSEAAASGSTSISSSLGSAILGSPIVSSAFEVLANAGLVVLLVMFFLIQQADLRDRIVSVAGRGALATTTKALEEAGARISRYLLMLFIVNATFGISVALGLWLMGVPYAITWGLVAGVIRYVPYIGPWVGATMPIAVSLVTAPGWTQPLLVAGLFVVLELVSNNIMEPVLYGQSVGISEIGIILSAILWAWLWGPIGLVLATPLTVCLVVLGRYVPGLRIFDHLLGDRAAVNPSVRLYQRLLARDEDDVEELLEQHREGHTILQTADELIVPALELIRHDLAHDQINDVDAEHMIDALHRSLEDMQEKGAGGCERTPGSPEPLDAAAVIGVASHVPEEELVLNLFNAACIEHGQEMRVLSSDLLQAERMATIEELAPELVVVSSLGPGDLPHTRQICKRLKATGRVQRIVVARWGQTGQGDRSRQLLDAGASDVVHSLAELEPIVRAARQMYLSSRVTTVTPATPSAERPTAQAG